MRLPVSTAFLLFAALSTALGQTRDDEVDKTFRAVRTEIAPVIDGALNEDAWSRANVESVNCSFP